MNQKLMVAVAALCACFGCVVVPDDVIRPGDPLAARFVLTWTVNDARTGTALDCRSIGADTVRIQARNMTTGDMVIDLFDCDVGRGETYAVDAGDYSVLVGLVACYGDPICRNVKVISELPTRTIYEVWTDGDVALGHFVFLID